MSDNQAITIRPLAPEDRAEWQRMWEGYLGFYRTELAPEVIDMAFSRLNSGEAGEFRGLMASVGERPAGLAHYLFHRHGWKVEPVCYLQDLWVEPAFRGTGLGRRLIEAVYTKADAADAGSVYWLTAENNYDGRRLYDRVGRRTPFIKYDRP